MNNKTVVVTGSTGAIGKATAFALIKNNCRLILIGRNAEKVSAVKTEITKVAGNNDIDIVIADLSEPVSVKNAVQEIKKRYSSLDALINVAAIFKKERLENSVGFEYMFATNHLGPFMLTNGLLDLLKAGKGRVVTVTAPSTTKINFNDLHGKNKFSAGFLGSFGASKMMNIMFTYALARRLDGTGVSATVFHPGLVKSNLTKDMPAILNFIIQKLSNTPDKAAAMLCSLAVGDTYSNINGKFFKYDGKELRSSKYSYDQTFQEKLWSVSEQLAR